MRNFGVKWLGGIPGGASGKELACQCRRCERRGFDPWVGKIPWRRAWQPTLVILPRKSHRERWGYSFRGVTKGQTRLKQLRHTHPRWLGAPATDTPGALGHTPLPAVQTSRLAFEKCRLFSSLLSTCTDLLQSPPFTDPNIRSPFSAQASHCLQCPSAEVRMGIVLQEPWT